MLVETFGAVALAALALPAFARAAQPRPATRGAARKAAPAKPLQRLTSVLLLFGLARAASAACAMLSAAVQRRHLYAWALFAPKFIFETLFLVMTDVIIVLLACFE
jgi:hypothetical protein